MTVERKIETSVFPQHRHPHARFYAAKSLVGFASGFRLRASGFWLRAYGASGSASGSRLRAPVSTSRLQAPLTVKRLYCSEGLFSYVGSGFSRTIRSA